MDINLFVFAAPIFILLIFFECIISISHKQAVYTFNDSLNNFSSGILEEIGLFPLKGAILYSYYFLSTHYAFFTVDPRSILSWFLLWIAIDFCYYWYHRASHRCVFLWIGHAVHHQSDQYNLSVALRQGYFQALTSWVFYLPLALLGFSIEMFVIVVSLNTIYQFWIHTKLIHKMGWFEYLFNTPSHHRVHHGINDEYIDKNYAGSLIIWDKLFGTFEPEVNPVEYGITEPLASWNPFYANYKVIHDVLYYSKGLKTKLDKVLVFFMPPDWIIKKLENEGVSMPKRQARTNKQVTSISYQVINMVAVICLYVYLSVSFVQHSVISWLIIALALATLFVLSMVANGNKNIMVYEIIRMSLIITILYFLQVGWVLSLLGGLLFMVINYALYCFSPKNVSERLVLKNNSQRH